MVMKECREGQNPELNNPCDRKFGERGVAEGIFLYQKCIGELFRHLLVAWRQEG